MSEELGQEDGVVSSRIDCKGEELAGWKGREQSTDTCARAGQLQVEIQVLEAVDLEALSTQTVIEALRVDRVTHQNV